VAVAAATPLLLLGLLPAWRARWLAGWLLRYF